MKTPDQPNSPHAKPSAHDFEVWLRDVRKLPEPSANFDARLFAEIDRQGQAPSSAGKVLPFRHILGWGIAASLVLALVSISLFRSTPAQPQIAGIAGASTAWSEEELILYASLFQGIDPDAFFEVTDLLIADINGS